MDALGADLARAFLASLFNVDFSTLTVPIVREITAENGVTITLAAFSSSVSTAQEGKAAVAVSGTMVSIPTSAIRTLVGWGQPIVLAGAALPQVAVEVAQNATISVSFFNRAIDLLKVEDLPEPLTLSMRREDAEQLACAYWDNDADIWSERGLVTRHEDDALICDSSHLSIFGTIPRQLSITPTGTEPGVVQPTATTPEASTEETDADVSAEDDAKAKWWCKIGIGCNLPKSKYKHGTTAAPTASAQPAAWTNSVAPAPAAAVLLSTPQPAPR